MELPAAHVPTWAIFARVGNFLLGRGQEFLRFSGAMAMLLARRQEAPRPFYHPNRLHQLDEAVRAKIRDQLDQRWHPVVQATFFAYMMKRMEDFGLSKKLKVPANYWRLDVCRIWLHKMTA